MNKNLLINKKISYNQIHAAKSFWIETFHSIGDVIIITDINEEINYMNPASEKITGWCLSDAAGLSLYKVFHIIDSTTKKSHTDLLERVLKEKKNVSLVKDTALITKNGEELLLSSSVALVKDAKDMCHCF